MPSLQVSGAGAGRYVGNGSGARLGEAEGHEFVVEVGQIGFADPAQDEVLLDGGADGFADVAAG